MRRCREKKRRRRSVVGTDEEHAREGEENGDGRVEDGDDIGAVVDAFNCVTVSVDGAAGDAE